MVANAQKLAALRTDMIGLNDIQNPFNAWLDTLRQMALELSKLANIKPLALTQEQQLANVRAFGEDILRRQRELLERTGATSSLLPSGSIPSTGAGTFMEGPEAARFYNQMSMGNSMGAGGTVVNVNVSGSVTTERDLVAAITQGLYSQQASGTPVNYSTVY